MRDLVGITGLARSGKDTVGQYLVMRRGYHRMAFADPLKEAMAALFGVPLEEFHSDALKDETSIYWKLTRREMLQQGADALRIKFGDDLFTKRWFEAYLNLADYEDVVVTDVRSDQEAQTIRDLGGKVIQVTRKGAGLAGAAGQHRTERGVSPELIDVVIENNLTVAELWASVEAFLEKVHAT